MKTFSHIPLELLFWVVAMLLLATATPVEPGHTNHFSLCALSLMGAEWCPGCGIGRAITQLFHGNVEKSIAHHWFAIPALGIILWRIIVLIRLTANYRGFRINKERYV